MKTPLPLLCLCLFLSASAAELPIVHETDVVVVGGSSGAVAAALAAREAGAKVFLLAPRPYLGEDMAGTLRVVRDPRDETDAPLYRALFDASHEEPTGLPFTYATDRPPAAVHADPRRTLLNDGRAADAVRGSVQFDGDVTVSVDLGKVCRIAGVCLDSFVRVHPRADGTLKGLPAQGYLTRSMAVSTSADGTTWRAAEGVPDVAEAGTDVRRLFLPVRTSCRYVKVFCAKAETYPRQLLGEIRVLAECDGRALASRTTPFLVKRTLDRQLLAAKVPYLTGALVCDVMTDAAGRFAGVVMANRSGRQVVRAKVLVDATPRATAARLAGGEAEPFPAGERAFQRIVISGERPTGEGVSARALTEPFAVPVKNHLKPDFPPVIAARFWLCDVKIPMADGSARAFAAAEQLARDRTFTATQVDAANSLTCLAPDVFRCRATAGTWPGAAALDLRCLQPRGTEGVYVLGPRAGLSDAARESFLKPGALIKTGTRVGRDAAARAGRTARAAAEKTAAGGPALRSGWILGEHQGELAAWAVNATGRVTAADALPVLASCDTLVVGAGTGGGPAGIAAARHGARTIVCEYLYVEGGVQTDGLIGVYWYGNRIGFTREIDEGTRALGSVFPQAKSEWYRSQQRQAGAEIWFGAFANGVVTDGARVVGVVVVMEDGTRGLVTCRNAIDATGNAELPAMAGQDTEFITDDELSLQGVGQAQNTLGVAYANSDIGFLDDTDATDVFYFALRSRLSLPEGTWDQAQVLNSRERRRLVGAFYMGAPDVVNGRTYPDTITRTYSNFDSHGQTRDDLFFIQDPGHQPMYVNLPYRCLLPKTLDGLLVTGLGISAHRDAMPILRMQPDIQNQGYAAGTAAALAVKNGTTVRNVDIKALQRHLVEKGILREEDTATADSFPLPDAAFRQATADLADGYGGLPVLMTDRSRALPLLLAAWQTAEGEGKFIYAHVLAMLGRPDGAEQVLARFKAADWDKGWNYRGMGQFNRSVSWMDSYAIALGHAQYRPAVPALIAKADLLTQTSEYSHFRAIAKALEELGDASAAPALAAVLKRPGIGGHWQTMGPEPPGIPGYKNAAGDWERTLSLREICIARALYRLGDTPEGLGRKTLEAYAADPRGAFARHAKLVLGRK
ncbi:MAG: FAD-dependent oxidoreductase [Kiritimatiellia bacterium]